MKTNRTKHLQVSDTELVIRDIMVNKTHAFSVLWSSLPSGGGKTIEKQAVSEAMDQSGYALSR